MLSRRRVHRRSRSVSLDHRSSYPVLRPQAFHRRALSMPSTASTITHGHKAKPVASIAGGVVGGIVIILLLLVCIFLWRKRNAYEPSAKIHTTSNSNSPQAAFIHNTGPGRLPTLTSGTTSPYTGTPCGAGLLGDTGQDKYATAVAPTRHRSVVYV